MIRLRIDWNARRGASRWAQFRPGIARGAARQVIGTSPPACLRDAVHHAGHMHGFGRASCRLLPAWRLNGGRSAYRLARRAIPQPRLSTSGARKGLTRLHQPATAVVRTGRPQTFSDPLSAPAAWSWLNACTMVLRSWTNRSRCWAGRADRMRSSTRLAIGSAAFSTRQPSSVSLTA